MIIDVDYARQLAAKLLQIQSVILRPHNPFTWSSGWKAPIYCDNRLLLSHPGIRTNVKQHLVKFVENELESIDAVAGVATAGIPYAALIADELDLPMAYVRSSAKKHGTENKVEGRVEAGQRVLVIEDLISTGGSSLVAVDTLRNSGCRVNTVCAVFTYGFDIAEKQFHDKEVTVHTLTDYHALLEVAVEKQYIGKEVLGTLKQWRNDPENWPSK